MNRTDAMPATDDAAFAAMLDRFASIVGEHHVLRAEADIEPYVTERRGLYPGISPLVLRPGSVDEVSRILKLATETSTAIVPRHCPVDVIRGTPA